MAKSITLDQVRHVAELAQLELSETEQERLRSELSDILGYVDKLNELDTTDVEPTAQVGEAGTRLRDDAVTNPHAAEEMLSNAPAREGHFVKVPRIID